MTQLEFLDFEEVNLDKLRKTIHAPTAPKPPILDPKKNAAKTKSVPKQKAAKKVARKKTAVKKKKLPPEKSSRRE
jgi:hypothetical protein